MRVSREVMAQHRKDIVAATSKMLRKHGIGGTSVIDLMRAVGLTHGGFYKHFKSKDALVAESTQKIFDDIIGTFEAQSREVGSKAALAAYVDRYLGSRHVRHPEAGCPLAAFGVDAARDSRAVRTAFKDGTSRLLALFESGLSCPKEKRREKSVELMALLSGAIVAARASGDAKLADEFLEHARRRAARIVADTR
ncbi:TetR family transcriptional regulator [Hyphomicrobium nitrativorans NL23]|uniref:TetR family transcriptional regulator n=1 Tax=Hyphomicrobium nitrativorans NL23 TaxID=1029756 RepID=V5SBE5_9HYPH|nr:TetR/AcrR family transcriptional regulator [Hyphomicrobium nitrativorans]AHB47838.1 TetR family transcriptional regulator [Hyphomicrobium nitrativorans NL23]